MSSQKKVLTLLLTVLLVVGLMGCNTEKKNDVIRLSTTTSVNDSGLMDYLKPEFEKDTGIKLEITSAGSGAAIEKGRTGDADCLLVHSPTAEEALIDEGYGEKRTVFMYNYFVIVGPPDDPAGVKDRTEASDAFKRIADHATATFVSRGDNSGTHSAEMAIWALADIDPEGKDWYKSTGSGMGASLNMASETDAYILTDKGTYLAHAASETLDILMEESDQMINIYSIIPISKDRWADANYDASETFVKWMTTRRVKDLIDEYGMEKYGEPLFFAYRD